MMQKYGLYLIWVLSCLSSLASLYLGEPSLLDWYQRVCLFPLIFIAGIAAWRGFLPIAPYLVPQALIGLAFSIYQILILKKAEWVSSLYIEPIVHPFLPFVFAGVFFFILVCSAFLSKKQSPEIFL